MSFLLAESIPVRRPRFRHAPLKPKSQKPEKPASVPLAKPEPAPLVTTRHVLIPRQLAREMDRMIAVPWNTIAERAFRDALERIAAENGKGVGYAR